MHLSIGGIELRPAVWRAAFEETAGADVSPSEDEAAAVALGYVAQFVDRFVFQRSLLKRELDPRNKVGG